MFLHAAAFRCYSAVRLAYELKGSPCPGSEQARSLRLAALRSCSPRSDRWPSAPCSLLLSFVHSFAVAQAPLRWRAAGRPNRRSLSLGVGGQSALPITHPARFKAVLQVPVNRLLEASFPGGLLSPPQGCQLLVADVVPGRSRG